MRKQVCLAALALTVLVFSTIFGIALSSARSKEMILSDTSLAIRTGLSHSEGDSIESGARSVSQTPDYWPTAGWRRSSPEEQGLNSVKLGDMMQYVRQQSIGIDSVVVVRNGYVVFEEYPRPLLYGPNNPHPLYSVTKSFSSALIGIAIEEGFIDGVQQRVLDFFPNRTFANMDTRKEAITLEHLLTMTSGLPWDESTYPYGDARNDVTRMMNNPDPVQFVLDRPMISEPGTRWVYNSGGSHILSAIINETTGADSEAFAKEHLFEPLGISNLFWGKDPFQHLSWGFAGLSLTPLDMAKFGFLYLHNGTWEGQQIIPAEWVTDSTKPHFSLGQNWEYGYQWWIGPPSNVYMARGYMGQNIIVAPDHNMVVVFTGSYTQGPDPSQLFYDYIMPAVGSTVPDQYPIIQEAIDQANEGGTVFVRSGTYYENIVVWKPLTLIGQNRETTVIDGRRNGSVVTITGWSTIREEAFGHNSTLRGFTIRNSGEGSSNSGILISCSSGNVVTDTIVSDNCIGVRLDSPAPNLLTASNTIKESTICNNSQEAVLLSFTLNNTVESNTIYGNGLGTSVISSSHNNISNNTFSGNGIRISGSENTVSNNEIRNAQNYGILIGSVEPKEGKNYVSCNNLVNNSDGIYLDNSFNNNITENSVRANGCGIRLCNSSQDTIYNNNLIDNNLQVNLDNASCLWDNGYRSGGNYWSDITGTDLYRGPYQNETGKDWIFDSQHILNANNTDKYPLTSPYGFGDLNSDAEVDVKDLGFAAASLGSHSGHPKWNPLVDVTGNKQFSPDGKVDIKDLVAIARHFGRHYH